MTGKKHNTNSDQQQNGKPKIRNISPLWKIFSPKLYKDNLKISKLTPQKLQLLGGKMHPWETETVMVS